MARKSQDRSGAHIYTIEDELDESNSVPDTLKNSIYEIFDINENSTQNEINDAEIVYIAVKHSAILVTNDGASKRQPLGILGRRHLLTKYLKIMTPYEAVKFVENLYKKLANTKTLKNIH